MHNCYMAMTLHSTLDVALVARRTIKAIVGGVLACEIPCGGTRYVGSGLSKYEGMRCTNRWERTSGKPMITSIQLSITLASILLKYYCTIYGTVHKREDCKFRTHPDFNESGMTSLRLRLAWQARN